MPIHRRYITAEPGQPTGFFDFIRLTLEDDGQSQPRQRLWYSAAGLWVLSLILTPVLEDIGGRPAFLAMTNVSVVLHATVTLFALSFIWRTRTIVLASAVVVMSTWGIEAIGASTGVPFGHYVYTDALQPQLADVPLLIPVAWLMMLPPSWAVADMFILRKRRHWPSHIKLAVVAGLAFAAWDLYLDPQMVGHGLWEWKTSGGYFGIPWVNFIGWWFSAFLITLFVRPLNLPRARLAIVYTLVWLLELVGLGIMWSQPLPALVGFVGMGAFVIPGWVTEYRRWKTVPTE